VEAKLGDPVNVAVGPDSVVYIRTRTSYDRIRKVTPDGMITAYAGQDDNCGGSLSPDGIAAQQACIYTNSAGLEIYTVLSNQSGIPFKVTVNLDAFFAQVGQPAEL
jgi:hypothetical protein